MSDRARWFVESFPEYQPCNALRAWRPVLLDKWQGFTRSVVEGQPKCERFRSPAVAALEAVPQCRFELGMAEEAGAAALQRL